MPIFLIFFILFVIWLNVKTKRGQNNNSEWDTDYWEKEREANFVRRKDISGLDYITISEDELPFSDTAEGEEKYREDQVRRILWPRREPVELKRLLQILFDQCKHLLSSDEALQHLQGTHIIHRFFECHHAD